MVIKTKESKNNILVYADNKYIGYIFINAGIYNYSFGRPSDPCVIAFEAASKEAAINRLVENRRDFLIAVSG